MTRKRPSIGDLRKFERHEAKPFNDNRVSLPNPQVNAPFDRHAPIPRDHKKTAFGLGPDPERLGNLIAGDAGAGDTFYRKIHAFFSLDQDGISRVGASNFTKALPIATVRGASNKPMDWHISVYGIGVRRVSEGAPLSPLTDSEIRDLQFEQYFVEFPAGVFVPLSPRFVPSVNTSQVRVMFHDESGQRFFDADVIGTRSFSVYGWGASVFLLVKENGYEVNAQNPSSNPPLASECGVEDDLVGGRIVGVFNNRTESFQNRTLSITIDPAEFPGQPRIIPIPPGARSVQIFSTAPAPLEASWRLRFWYGRASSATRADVGVIDWNVGQSRTSIVNIPNAPSIAIEPNAAPVPPIASFSLVFEVEP